jgi:hypothetical protein
MTKWRRLLGFGDEWRFVVDVNNSPDDCPEEVRDAAGYARVNDGYSSATIGINAWRIEDAKTLEAVLLHELLHGLTWQVRGIVRDAFGAQLEDTGTAIVEQLVETLTRAFLRAQPTKRAR